MKTYEARVYVTNASGSGKVAQRMRVQADSPGAAFNQLVALYGRGNVIGVPVLVT